MEAIPQEIRLHIAGFIPAEHASQGYYTLDIDPAIVVDEMYHVGLDPVKMVDDEILFKSRAYVLDRVVDNTRSGISSKVYHQPGSDLTTFEYGWVHQRINVSSLMERIKQRFTDVSLVNQYGYTNFSIRDPNAEFYRAYITAARNSSSSQGHYGFNKEFIRRADFRLTPETFNGSKTCPTELQDRSKALTILNQLAQLHLYPARLIAQRRADQRDLRRLMKDPRWEIFKLVDGGKTWRAWVADTQWGDQLEIRVSGELYEPLRELVTRFGLNHNSVNTRLAMGEGFVRIIEPGFGLARYIASVVRVLTSRFIVTLMPSFLHNDEMVRLHTVSCLV